MSLNVCTLTGRLGRDAEQKYLPTGTAVIEFSIAVDTGFGDKRRSFWIKCSMFGDRGPKLAQYLRKGQQVQLAFAINLGPITKLHRRTATVAHVSRGGTGLMMDAFAAR